MEMLAVIVVILFILWIAARSSRHATGPGDRAHHLSDDRAHLYYTDERGQTLHESDSCSLCAADRAAELERRGYSVEFVPGRHNSGDLAW
jgi:hypothetical protein